MRERRIESVMMGVGGVLAVGLTTILILRIASDGIIEGIAYAILLAVVGSLLSLGCFGYSIYLWRERGEPDEGL